MSDSTDHVPAESTLAARGGWVEDFSTRPSAPPVYLTTAFDLEDLQHLDAVVAGQQPGYIYTRDGNPNHEAFAADVAALEGAEAGVVTASGMGALTATLLALVKTGDHIVAGRALYGRSGQMLNHLAASFGIQVTFVDTNDIEAVRQAVTPETKLCLVESVTNPLIDVTDLPAVAKAIGNVPLLVDNTFATPCLLKPIAHGATLVWHSASKYLNGHGDVMLGVLAGPKSLIRKIRGLAALYGVNSNPFESWLGSRGLRTLPLRMARVTQTATRLAGFLSQHRAVSRVHYAGLPSHRCHAIAMRLLPRGCGGMLSFELPGGRTAVDALFRGLAGTIPFSPTLADARTTLSYPAGTSHKFLTAEERAACGITEGLVRLSVGLEDPADLEQELSAALMRLAGLHERMTVNMTKPVATSRVCPVPVVGLVGGVGSGKSAVARWVADRHPVLVIDGDRAGHQALELPAVREQLRQQFGPGIFDADGNVIRSALARLVFGDTAAHRLAREQLERIVHPEIRRLLEQQLRAVNASTIRHVLLDAAVLLEAGWSEVCDAIVFVESSKAVREARVAGRGWSAAELSRREASQWPLEKKRKAATAVVENDGPLESAGAALWSLLLRWAPD